MLSNYAVVGKVRWNKCTIDEEKEFYKHFIFEMHKNTSCSGDFIYIYL